METELKEDIKRDAIFDKTGKYRYVLKRQWSEGNNFANFIMLNPSTADEKIDDPTIRRCITFAKTWGYDGIYVTNLFALRTSHPKILKNSNNPIGKDNDSHLKNITQTANLVVAGWGNHGSFLNRDKEVLNLLKNRDKKIYCLELSKQGQPKHPLFLKNTIKPVLFQREN